ncbi:heterokaryon incompatibility protein-domain-containing protein [Apiospora sp. TS-2023a]
MACSESKLYEHHPLDPVRRQIRTLHVLPGHGNQPISIKLKVQDLEDPSTNFIALSYVWGTETASEVVQADKENIQVTVNLLNCLRHLRDTQHSLVLWVDAICINQDDLREKSAQVAMMGYIYSRCSTVCCWLGAPPDSASAERDPFELIHHFAANKHYHDLPGYSVVGSADARFEENTEFLALWERFLSVANSAWWTRAWTVQEAVVPKDSVLRLGKWSINFETVITSRQLRNSHLLQCFENSPLGPQGWPKTFPEFRCRPFYELVLTFSNRACSNPRDKVFSLLALAKSPVMKAHRPDYSRSVIDTYTQAFRLMLDETDNDFRCLMGPTFGSANPDSPSWVPDFSQVIPPHLVEFTLRRIMMSSLFKTSNVEPGKVDHLPGRRLSISGLYADTVSFVSSTFEPVDRAPNQVREILADWSAVGRRTLSTSDDSIVRQTLSCIMCASIGFVGTPYDAFHGGWRRLREGDLPSAAEWQQFTDGNMWALPEVYRGTMETISSGRCLFATEGGRLGLCYKTVQPGD